MLIRDATALDAAAIAAIYNPYILDSTISFEEEAVTADDMATRMAAVQEDGLPWLVLEREGAVAGYAYATKWRVRHAYRFSVETTVYLAPAHAGRGGGSALYTALLERLRAAGCHLAIGGIAQPNAASVALHERMGYRKVAHFGEVGFKFGRWIDVGYWERRLDD
ncbi:arsinothricin resistance N-acetyltransferase ArsN1 family B [Pseudoduganella chitinolytica]|uniref:GNAT family N-acetyltransferase n=1 Tax=Pseudoduganella chitinolytica TaxID=34070 RepID=A0ABY8BF91_9BURK|nr:arsinothricin resistance N-acetyltransferase ArsN1 family B [Pseudoduganella chitinolytica]WEF34565.1 GNAT family N-acetyltransferase [Pseudoduganella chitinolytica]